MVQLLSKSKGGCTMKLKEISFTGNSSKEWEEFNRIYHQVFWDKLYGHVRNEYKDMLQGQINEEFNIQLGADKYERTNNRLDKRNGYRTRSYEILGGYINDLQIPRSRNLKIHYSVFGMWERVQNKVLDAMVVAYIMGKSSSAAQEILEAFGQSKFSRTFLCRLVKRFENRLKQYRECIITKNWNYVFIDGMAVKVYDAYLQDKIVIFALGMDNNKQTELLGWVVTDGEDETSVRSLLINLKNRGLKTPDLFISDGAKFIESAMKLEYPHTERQLCCFHKIKNIQTNLEDIKNRKYILREAGDIFEYSNTKKEALSRLNTFKTNWYKKEPEAVRLFVQDFEKTLKYFKFPQVMWRSIRTNNPLEQYIGKMRAWLSKFTYFYSNINLELAMFTHVCYKNKELVPKSIDCFSLKEHTFV